MPKKTYFVIGIMLISSIFMVVHALAWNFSGRSVECEGFWDKNVDTSASTDCTVMGLMQADGTYGSFNVAVWCVNPNDADKVKPPKYTNVSVTSGSESNQNGRKVKGKVNLVIHIDGTNVIDSSICNQGQSNPHGNGQWYVGAWLPASPFIGVVTTDANGPGERKEVYTCGMGTLFDDGTNLDDHLAEIEEVLASGGSISSLNLTYNCQLDSAT